MQNERDTVLSALTHSISVAYEDLLKNHVESEKVRYREHEVYEKLINRNTEIISILYDIVKKYV
jgi:predicted phage-related endonuclease